MHEDFIHWFDSDMDPIVKHGRPLLSMVGQHARLSNIDDKGTCIRDEAFDVNGVLVFHKGGYSARGLLSGGVKLRRECPEAHNMLQGISEFQQPVGFQDRILSAWRTEEQPAESPQRCHIRDLSAS